MNDTRLAWFNAMSEEQQRRITRYLRGETMPDALVAAALASVARWTIIPLQDLLELGAGHRIDTRGTAEGNWHWRLQKEQLTPTIAAKLRELNTLYGRS